MTRTRPLARRMAAAAVAIALAATTAACGQSRSAEAFCAVVKTNQDRFTATMTHAVSSVQSGQTGEVVGGVAEMIGALGDLQTMWHDLADVAPEQIQTDVERLRDENDRQLETVKEHPTEPLTSLGGILVGALTTSGSATRVATFVTDNCRLG